MLLHFFFTDFFYCNYLPSYHAHFPLRVLRSNHFYLHSHRWFSNRAPCVLKHLAFELKGDSLKVPHFRFICGLTVGSINWVKVSYKQRASDLPLTDIKHFLSPHAVKRLIGQILTVAHTVKRLRSKYEKKKKEKLKSERCTSIQRWASMNASAQLTLVCWRHSIFNLLNRRERSNLMEEQEKKKRKRKYFVK